jgi:hypothetical protein
MSELMQAPPENDLSSLDEGTGSGRNSRLIALVAVAGGVVVLGLAAFFLFFSGGGDEELGGTVTTPPVTAQGKDGGGKGDGSGKQDEIPPTFQDTVGRDPFKALPAEAVVEPPAPEPTETTEPTGTNAPPPLQPDYYQATLQSVDGKTATIVVNGVGYEVKVDERFPDSTSGPFQLVRIAADGKSVFLKWGSESVELTFKNGFVGELG